jgi:hypothetical protein
MQTDEELIQFLSVGDLSTQVAKLRKTYPALKTNAIAKTIRQNNNKDPNQVIQLLVNSLNLSAEQKKKSTSIKRCADITGNKSQAAKKQKQFENVPNCKDLLSAQTTVDALVANKQLSKKQGNKYIRMVTERELSENKIQAEKNNKEAQSIQMEILREEQDHKDDIKQLAQEREQKRQISQQNHDIELREKAMIAKEQIQHKNVELQKNVFMTEADQYVSEWIQLSDALPYTKLKCEFWSSKARLIRKMNTHNPILERLVVTYQIKYLGEAKAEKLFTGKKKYRVEQESANIIIQDEQLEKIENILNAYGAHKDIFDPVMKFLLDNDRKDLLPSMHASNKELQTLMRSPKATLDFGMNASTMLLHNYTMALCILVIREHQLSENLLTQVRKSVDSCEKMATQLILVMDIVCPREKEQRAIRKKVIRDCFTVRKLKFQ